MRRAPLLLALALAACNAADAQTVTGISASGHGQKALYDSTPAAPGTASAGTSALAARGDHVHPRQLPSLEWVVASSGITTTERAWNAPFVLSPNWTNTASSAARVYSDGGQWQIVVALSAAVASGDTMTLRYYSPSQPGGSFSFGTGATSIGTMVNSDGTSKTFTFTAPAGDVVVSAQMTNASMNPTSRFRLIR